MFYYIYLSLIKILAAEFDDSPSHRRLLLIVLNKVNVFPHHDVRVLLTICMKMVCRSAGT